MAETPHDLMYQIEAIPDNFVAENFLPMLSAVELQRYKSMKDELRQKQFLYGRFLLKKKLSIKMGVPTHEIKILISPTGKPNVEGLWHVSLSHSEKFCAIAVSDHCVGIDLQKKKCVTNLDKILKRICHKNEWMFIEQKNQNEKEDFFFKIWTLKEAYSKCLGSGLQIQLSQQDFSKILFSKESVTKLGNHTFYHSQKNDVHFAFCLNNEH